MIRLLRVAYWSGWAMPQRGLGDAFRICGEVHRRDRGMPSNRWRRRLVRYYSAFTDALAYLPPDLNQRIGSEAFVDLAVTYRVTSALSVTAGAENILDNYPDRYTGPLAAYGLNYPSLRPYEADGGKYDVRLAASF
jgi:hypothetical protein